MTDVIPFGLMPTLPVMADVGTFVIAVLARTPNWPAVRVLSGTGPSMRLCRRGEQERCERGESSEVADHGLVRSDQVADRQGRRKRDYVLRNLSLVRNDLSRVHAPDEVPHLGSTRHDVREPPEARSLDAWCGIVSCFEGVEEGQRRSTVPPVEQHRHVVQTDRRRHAREQAAEHVGLLTLQTAAHEQPLDDLTQLL